MAPWGWRYVKIMWKPLGTRHPEGAGSCALLPLLAPALPLQVQWAGCRWGGEKLEVCHKSGCGVYGGSGSTCQRRGQFRCLLDTTRFCKLRISVLVLARHLIGAVTENVGLQKIPKQQKKDHIIKIRALTFHPFSWSHIINLFRNLLVHSQPVGILSIFFLSFLGISSCNYTSLLPYIFP